MGSYSISLQLLVQGTDWFINIWQFVKVGISFQFLLHTSCTHQKLKKKNMLI